MRTFHYFAPGPEEQRGFAMQFLGTVLGLGVVAFVFWRASDSSLRGLLVGAGLALIFRLVHASWQLEQKAQRAQNAAISVDENGLHLTDAKGKTQTLAWDELEDISVAGGRLKIKWKNGAFVVGAREIEDGMTMVRLVMHKGQDEPPKPTNFIPLSPM
ncbi:MAG TPA: hypothetical protein VGB77_17080 [Abditibacteriaceae bacterium]